MPILSMLQRVKQQLMTRYYSKQQEAAEFVGTICPKIRKKVAKNAEFANVCYALPSGQGIFQVNERDNQYIVDIRAKECECRRWQLTGIPCQHAISCLRHERIQSESVVHECYSIQSFHRAYESNILPCKDMSTWEKVNGPLVLPPLYEKKVGRPPKSRRKQPHEVQGKHGPRMSKHGVIIRCGYCHKENHNAKGCFLKKMGIRPEDYIPDDATPVAEEHAPQRQEENNFNVEAPPQGSQYLTQEAPAMLMSQMSSTMLMKMMEEGSQSAFARQPVGPLPDSLFISTNKPLSRPVALTTATKQGKAATKKRKASKEGNAIQGKKSATANKKQT
ncbi:unnamed protein product [Urochloa humidicola]